MAVTASVPTPSGAAAPTLPPANPADSPRAVAGPRAPVILPGSIAASATPRPSNRPQPKDFAPAAELADIHFDFDRSDIRPGDAKILDSNAPWRQGHLGNLVLVEGHCDERGTSEYNMALGDRRAKAAMNYLVSRGVRADRISILSYGEERPFCMDHHEACWAKNRRARFLIKPE
jgi:peptidoglycan-associated lipoprotein